MRLLLAEDNPADARLVHEMLASAPHGVFEIVHAERLDAAMLHLQQETTDVLLLDLGLPDSQGIRTLEMAQAANRSVPIVVLTGLDDDQFANTVVRAGAQDYLVKGHFDAQLLLRTIRYAAERKQAEEKIRALAAIVSSSREAITSATLAGNVLTWNAGAERIYGYTAEEMIGTPIQRLAVTTPADDTAALLARLQRGALIEQHETVHRRRDGQEINVSLSYAPIQDGQGRMIAVSIIASDITARKRAEDALVRSHAELRRFNEMSVGRELRMIALKHEVNSLAAQLGRPPPYRLDFVPDYAKAGVLPDASTAPRAFDDPPNPS